MNKAHLLASKNLINHLGVDFTLLTHYWLSSDAKVGDTTVYLKETSYIQIGHVFTLGSEQITVKAVYLDHIDLETALTSPHITGDYISAYTISKAVTVPRGTGLTRDNLEYIRRVRIPLDSQINYGSTAHYLGKDFFVTGLDQSDQSLMPKLTEANGHVTLQRMQVGEFNGFSYDTSPVAYATLIPAYLEHISSETQTRDVGKLPATYQMATVPEIYKAQIDDILVKDNIVYRVIGIDQHRMNNLDTLFIDYDRTLQENEGGV